jgi:hypothetical protein
VIEKVDFVGVMEVGTGFELGVEGLVVGNLLVVELDDFRWYCAGESGELEEVGPFASEVPFALVEAWAVGDLDLIP